LPYISFIYIILLLTLAANVLRLGVVADF